MSFLKNIDHQNFLNSYWEKEHLFLPNAFDTPRLSLSEKEILALSLDEDIESRLVTQEKDQSWDLEFGPLDDLDFLRSKKRWTLFIHNFNLLETFSQELQKQSAFIPSWLFDDVLCSLSTDGASVGAHFDRYNVFILQISGKRCWKIQKDPLKKFKKDVAIKVLEEFTPDVEYELSPGDMIFIPPECAHEGTSIGNSISLSLGFKSLESAQIMQYFATEILENMDETEYFKTTSADFTKNSFEVQEQFISALHKKIAEKINDPIIFKEAFMKFLTLPKSSNFLENSDLSWPEFEQELKISKIQFVDELRYVTYAEEFWINQTKSTPSIDERETLLNLIVKNEAFAASELSINIKKIFFELYCDDQLGFVD